MSYFRTENLTVGYNGKPLIRDIDLELEKGKILTLIGPNGAGKSTFLKTAIRQIPAVGGKVFVDGRELHDWAPREFAREVAVVLTERIRPELMNCAEVVAMGRYPYTGVFGKLSDEDLDKVASALEKVHATDLAEQDFSTLSDGQRQRIMLARAICQEPKLIILDEPTAYLDIRYKVELLAILRRMAREEGITVVMSLHEIDLASKVSDTLLCLKGDRVAAFGPPEEVMASRFIEELYGMKNGSYNLLFGSVELKKPEGEPQVFVVAGGGCGVPVYRELQKRDVPFATGILFENDADFQVACGLSDHVVSAPAFRPMEEEQFREAAALMRRCGKVIDAGAPEGELNGMNRRLLELAREEGLPVTGPEGNG